MQDSNIPHRSLMESIRASLLMLGFGLSVLAFLIAIDRPEWFHVRPATGTAAAMANASTHLQSDQRRANDKPVIG
ncbi:hypothetical protein HRV97_05915 [Sphingomonas sp. HHU CXW]|uniref:Uncharacterized protein n=1 Tax=Sphingomonas hominis TaxID=2741495 RepID=A0ABX2JFZ6_9SPHN|nr:hypothetical protein [Sphingomonas hominis]NTS64689.1 hypothetical protein [Sphingomonas hominis]